MLDKLNGQVVVGRCIDKEPYWEILLEMRFEDEAVSFAPSYLDIDMR
jgi:hypothetical protein